MIDDFDDLFDDVDVEEISLQEIENSGVKFREDKPKKEEPQEEIFKDYNDRKIKKKPLGERDILEVIDDKEVQMKKTKVNGLTLQQLEAIEYLVQGNTNSQVARNVNVKPATITTWKKNPRFNEVLEDTKKQYMSAYQSRVIANIPKAIQTIVDIMEDVEVAPKERLVASRTILEFSNIKKGGLETLDKEDGGANTVSIIMVNNTPPQTMPMPPKDNKDNDVVIDAEFLEQD